MSIEQAIQENTAAINRLIEALGATTPAAKPAAETAKPAAEKPAAEKPAAEKPAEKPKASAAKKQEEKPVVSEKAASGSTQAGQDSSDDEISFEDLSKVVVKLAQTKGRNAAITLLIEHGAKPIVVEKDGVDTKVAKAQDLPKANYKAFMDGAEDLMNAEESLV